MLPLSKPPTAQFITASFTGKTYSEELPLKRYAPEAGNYGRARRFNWLAGRIDRPGPEFFGSSYLATLVIHAVAHPIR
jgi:hypothetical protein